MSRARVIVGTDDRGRPVSEWPAEDAPYGFMEPAFESTVERRQATPDELAAAVARETPARYLRPAPTAAKPRGGWTPHDIAELKATTGAVTGEDLVRAITKAGDPPDTVEEGIMAECFDVIGSPASSAPVSAPETPDDEPEPPKALRQPGHHDSHAGQSTERAERAARVTEAVARHGGDRSAAAAELGMRPNAVAMVMKHVARRAEATA